MLSTCSAPIPRWLPTPQSSAGGTVPSPESRAATQCGRAWGQGVSELRAGQGRRSGRLQSGWWCLSRAGGRLLVRLRTHRLRGQQLDRGRHAGEEAPAPPPSPARGWGGATKIVPLFNSPLGSSLPGGSRVLCASEQQASLAGASVGRRTDQVRVSWEGSPALGPTRYSQRTKTSCRWAGLTLPSPGAERGPLQCLCAGSRLAGPQGSCSASLSV